MSRLALYLSDLQRFGIAPGLQRIRALLARAGDPYLQYPHILIGGTNGKGSTAESAARALAQNGRRIGLYTSPHLYSWNERIRVLPGAGLPQLFAGAVSDAELDGLLEDALPHIEGVAAQMGQPTEFEVMTFLGLWHFARAGVEAAVLEVGLGGKWDATNASEPKVSCVTHVALDHCDRLGNTLEAIASDKVCIARAGRPLLTAETKPNVLEVFRAHCQKVGADLVEVAVPNGDFQSANRALALEVAGAFACQIGWDAPTAIPKFEVPGRAEIIAQNPRVIIDGANNPDGAQQLAARLRQLGVSKSELILIVGILADKDWRAMLEILAPLARAVICTASDSPRALPTSELAAGARAFNTNVEAIATVEGAVARARALAGVGGTVLVTGSFTTIAGVPRP